jgi:hypothetical protein
MEVAADTVFSGVRINRSGAGAMLTYSANSLVRYRGAEAPVSTTDSPKVCMSGTSEKLRNAIIVRLAQKKTHRELQIGRASAFGGMKMAYRDKDITDVTIAALSADAVEISPKLPLRPGQYILFPQELTSVPAGTQGYDFGVGHQ